MTVLYRKERFGRKIVLAAPPYRVRPDRVRYWRTRRHLTLKKLEAASGVSFTQISRIENGHSPSPRFDTMEALAGALSVDVDLLLEFDGDAEAAAG